MNTRVPFEMTQEDINAAVRQLCELIDVDVFDAVGLMDDINKRDDNGELVLSWVVIQILEDIAALLCIELEPDPAEDDTVENRLFPGKTLLVQRLHGQMVVVV